MTTGRINQVTFVAGTNPAARGGTTGSARRDAPGGGDARGVRKERTGPAAGPRSQRRHAGTAGARRPLAGQGQGVPTPRGPGTPASGRPGTRGASSPDGTGDPPGPGTPRHRGPREWDGGVGRRAAGSPGARGPRGSTQAPSHRRSRGRRSPDDPRGRGPDHATVRATVVIPHPGRDDAVGTASRREALQM